MALSELLTPVDLEPGAQALVAVDPTSRFVFVATENGPERVDSAHRRVFVPMHDWQAKGIDENDEIVRTLVEASASNPLKVSSPAAIDSEFWVRQRGWRAALAHPSLFGKFLIPEGPMVIMSEHVPPTMLVLVGVNSGFLVRQGFRRGIVTNKAQGLLQVQFFSV